MIELNEIFNNQRAAFAKKIPDSKQRLLALETLSSGLTKYQDQLINAVSEDFGNRAKEETLLLELFPLFDQIKHAKRHLKKWMKPKTVSTVWFLWPSRTYYQYQPLGVAGVIGAWNYQLLLTLGPVIDAIAAGNHVFIKPSEVAPKSAEVIKQMISEFFDASYVACITGGPDLAAQFSALPFDHLFFTGSTRVGRLVMQAAAKNLTPVTLELGGKSPALIHEDCNLEMTVKRIVAAKLLNSGQTCVAPDYVLLPEKLVGEFEALCLKYIAEFYPSSKDNKDFTKIVSLNHADRLRALVKDAEQKGAKSVTGTAIASSGNYVVPTLVFSVNDSMQIMQEEIFGPLLPVMTYKNFAEGLEYINSHPRPLALYYFDTNSDRIKNVVASTMSGGVTINDCIYHLAQVNLPFGGVGPSGMGQYHGFDGFVTFSKKRPVMIQRSLATSELLRPPYTSRRKSLINMLMRIAKF